MATSGKNKAKIKQMKKNAETFNGIHDKITEITNDQSFEEWVEMIKQGTKIMPKEMKHKAEQKIQQMQLAKDEANQEMESITNKDFFEKMFGLGEVRIDDGDQSPVSGAEAAKLKYMWARGMTWDPNSLIASRWMRILAAGDIDALVNYIKNKTDEEVRQLLEQRETKLNFSALFHVVKGAMTNSISSYPSDFKPRHVECICKLLDLGANVHARDFAGFTPLHYCVTQFASNTSLKMAKILLKRGADVNAANRMGCTPLAEPVMGMRVDCVKLLLENGADPTIRDYDGCSVESQHQAQHKTMKPLFVEARKRRARQMREEAKKEFGGNLRMCQVCGESTGTSRCTGCFITRYCGPECQRVDWENHKNACKEIASQYAPVKLTKPENVVLTSGRTGKVKVINKNQQPAKQNFVVKIQIPFDDTSAKKRREFFSTDPDANKTPGLTLYDEKKTVVGEIGDDEPSYPTLVEKIRAEGVFGDKGFFYAVLDKRNNLKINTTKILPPEVW